MQRRRYVQRFREIRRKARLLGGFDAVLEKALDRAKTRNQASLKSTSTRGMRTCLNMEQAVTRSSAAIAKLRDVMRSGDLQELADTSGAARCALITAVEALHGPVGARICGPGVRRFDVVARKMGDSVRIQNARNAAREARMAHLMEEDPTGYAERVEAWRHHHVCNHLREKAGFVHDGGNTQDWEETGRQMRREQANKVPALIDGIRIALQEARVLAPTVVMPSATVPLDSDELLDIRISKAAILACAVDAIQALLRSGIWDAEADLLDCPVPVATLEVEESGGLGGGVWTAREKDLLDALKRVVLAAEEVALPGVDKEEFKSVSAVLRRTAGVLPLLAAGVEDDELLLEALERDLSNDELPLEAPDGLLRSPPLDDGAAAPSAALDGDAPAPSVPACIYDASKYYGVGLDTSTSRWQALGYDPFVFCGDGLKPTDLGCYSTEKQAALVVDGFLQAKCASLYSNQVRFPKDFENVTETERDAELRGRSLVDIIPDDMQPADAEQLNNTLDEDPELMAYELERTYGGCEPGEALGGFEDLDPLDVMPENRREQSRRPMARTAVQGGLPENGRAQGRRPGYRCRRCGAERKAGHICPALVERSMEVQTVPIGPNGQAIVGSGEGIVTVRSYKSASDPSSGTELCGNQISRRFLNHDFHAVDATPAQRPRRRRDVPARWRGDAGSSPLDGASTAASSPRDDFVKIYRVHPTHWLISTQAAAVGSPVGTYRLITPTSQNAFPCHLRKLLQYMTWPAWVRRRRAPITIPLSPSPSRSSRSGP